MGDKRDLHLAKWHLFPEGYLLAWTKLGTGLTSTPGFLFGHLYVSLGDALLQLHKTPEAQAAFATAMQKIQGLPQDESKAVAARIAALQQQ